MTTAKPASQPPFEQAIRNQARRIYHKEDGMEVKEKVTGARRRYRQAVRDAWTEVDVRSNRPITPSRMIARRVAARTGLPVEVVVSGVREEPARRGRILQEQTYRRLVAAGGDDLAVMMGVAE
jgi:hypothetical protein